VIAINSRGDFCHGVGGGYFNINNVAIRPGGSGGWIDDDHAALADGTDDWKVAVYDVPTGQVTRGHPEYPAGVVTTDIKAGGGVYASWPGVGGVLASTGWTYPDSGLLGVGPDGAIAYKPSYQSGGPSRVRERDGSEWQLTPNHPYDLQLLGQHRALFNDTVLGFTVLGIPMPERLPGANWFPHAFLLEGQWWFGCQNERAGVIAHPFDNPHRGYVIVPPGINAWPSFRALDRYTLLCVWSNSEAEQAGQLTPRLFDVRTDALVDIIQVDPKPPDPPDPPQPPPLVAPEIEVLHYDRLIKAGVPWHVKFTTGKQDTVDVSKDAKDQLHVVAWNAAGTDETALTRQLTVEGPEAPPEPPEPTPTPPGGLGRFWLQPNIGSVDQAQILDDPSRLDAVDVVAIPVQQILTDDPTAQLGPNTYPNLYAAGFFSKLPKPLVVEMGSVKDGDCQAEGNIRGMQDAVVRVAEAGGAIAGFSADEPITNSRDCQQSLEATADGHAAWTHAVRALGLVVIYLEAWPAVPLADVETFFHLLEARDALPDIYHPDTDWERAEEERKDPEQFIRDAQALAEKFGIVFGVFVNSTVDPIATDPEHHQNLLDLAERIVRVLPTAAQVHVAAWATRDGTVATQNVPNNLGPAGLLDTFGQVHARFVDTPPPEPPEPGDDMLYATLIEPTKDRGPVVVKEVKPVAGEKGVYTLILPDDLVFSLQPPDGTDDTRPAGTAGQYERCTVSGNAATFRPTPDLVFVRFFSLVAGL